MRAVALLCLLHAAVGQDRLVTPTYSWHGPQRDATLPGKDPAVCLSKQSSCGCCLMQEQVRRMELHFNKFYEEIKKKMIKTKTNLDAMRANRSAFCVALDDNKKNTECFGPKTTDELIVYKNVFTNLGNGYNAQTGIFTAPRSGVYSLSVTLYAGSAVGHMPTCARLQVNNNIVSVLREVRKRDLEDSSTLIAAVRLEAGDQVAASLPAGCVICSHGGLFNTFAGFLLYGE